MNNKIDSAGGAKCGTCNDHGMIGGPSYYAPDEGGEPCPDCAPQPAEGDGAVETLLRKPAPLQPGCYCKPGQCAAPVVMGRQTACRDPEKAARPATTAQVPDGFVLVPRSVTNSMQIAGLSALDDSDATPTSIGHQIGYKAIRELWAAMLTAAPAAPKGGVVDEAEAAYLQSLGDDPALDGWYPEPLPNRKQADPPRANACATFLRDFIAEYEEHEEDEWSAAWQGLADRARALATGEQP